MRLLKISELIRGDHLYDSSTSYKVYSDPIQNADGVWSVETTDSGDYEVTFTDGAVIYTHPPEGNMYHGSKWDPWPNSRFSKE